MTVVDIGGNEQPKGVLVCVTLSFTFKFSNNFYRRSSIKCTNVLVRRYGTRCPTISEIRRVVLTVLSSFLRQSCLVFTNVTSALEVF